MATNRFADRVVPMDQWLLVEEAPRASGAVLVAEKNESGGLNISKGAPAAQNHGIVRKVGPGEYSANGTLIPVNPEITEGRTVVFPAKVAMRPYDFKAEMEAERLWFVPAHTVLCVLRPEGVLRAAPKSVLTA